jgi:hypothetical protein
MEAVIEPQEQELSAEKVQSWLETQKTQVDIVAESRLSTSDA